MVPYDVYYATEAELRTLARNLGLALDEIEREPTLAPFTKLALQVPIWACVELLRDVINRPEDN